MMCPNRGNLFQPRAAVSAGFAAGTTPVTCHTVTKWGNMFAHPRTDGVVDPVGPDDAEILENAVVLATLGTLRDPANPPGAGDESPHPGVPTLGDDE
jgi:hypothetical protein